MADAWAKLPDGSYAKIPDSWSREEAEQHFRADPRTSHLFAPVSPVRASKATVGVPVPPGLVDHMRSLIQAYKQQNAPAPEPLHTWEDPHAPLLARIGSAAKELVAGAGLTPGWGKEQGYGSASAADVAAGAPGNLEEAIVNAIGGPKAIQYQRNPPAGASVAGRIAAGLGRFIGGVTEPETAMLGSAASPAAGAVAKAVESKALPVLVAKYGPATGARLASALGHATVSGAVGAAQQPAIFQAALHGDVPGAIGGELGAAGLFALGGGADFLRGRPGIGAPEVDVENLRSASPMRGRGPKAADVARMRRMITPARAETEGGEEGAIEEGKKPGNREPEHPGNGGRGASAQAGGRGGDAGESGVVEARPEAAQEEVAPKTSRFTIRQPEEPEGRGVPKAPPGSRAGAVEPPDFVKKFVEQDLVPATERGAELAKGVKKELHAIFSPASMDESAGKEALIVRANAGEMARSQEQSRAAMQHVAAHFDTLPEARQFAFTDAVETGNVVTLPPEYQETAAVLREAFDKKIAEVQAVDPEALQNLIEGYMPHYWQNPERAGVEYARVYGRRPLEGSKAFLHRRSIMTTAEGIAAGLKPVTMNPIELTMMKLHEMDRYIFGTKVISEMHDQGLLKRYGSAGEAAADGYAPINDKLARIVERRETVKKSGAPGAPEYINRGAWYAPEGAARVLNNHLSPGLSGSNIYRSARAVANAMNQAQLGLSGFHLVGTGINAGLSKLALSAEQLPGAALEPGSPTQRLARAGRGLRSVAQSPFAFAETAWRGDKVLREYLERGSHPEMAATVDALVKGGGRVGLDPIYRTGALGNFWKAWHRGNYVGAGLRAPFALLEATMKPTMEYYVPRVKLGAFMDLADEELMRLRDRGIEPNEEQTRRIMANAWDSIDNRFGQLNYDNLFWNKTLRDLGHIGVRSLGWNLGTFREFGGAAKDAATPRMRREALGGTISHRMAYAMTFPMGVALLGALYGYAHGRPPREIRDYFEPHNGHGDDRISLPTYAKDFMSYGRNAGKTLMNKVNPEIATIRSLFTDKDFRGKDIWKARDPLAKRFEKAVEYVVGQYVPISLRNATEARQKHEGLEQQVEQGLGVSPVFTPKRRRR